MACSVAAKRAFARAYSLVDCLDHALGFSGDAPFNVPLFGLHVYDRGVAAIVARQQIGLALRGIRELPTQRRS